MKILFLFYLSLFATFHLNYPHFLLLLFYKADLLLLNLHCHLVVSTIMMFAGIYGFFTRRNTLAILISVELMLNATDINFAVFNRFLFPGGMEGYFFALFSIAISAAETAIAIAIMINIYRNIRSIQVRNLDELKW